MVPFNFPNKCYLNINIPGITDARSAHLHPTIEGVPFIGDQFCSFLQQNASLLDTNGSMHFGIMGFMAKTEKDLRLKMKYPVKEFLDCHKNFSDNLARIIDQSSNHRDPCDILYKEIINTISEYDQNLIHLHEDIVNLFFDYTDLLEAVFLVSKRRDIDASDIRPLLVKFNSIYNDIYTIMISNDYEKVLSIADELYSIKEEIRNRGLLPTDEEYEIEIAETVDGLNDVEREELACMLRN